MPDLGVDLRFNTLVDDVRALPEADLLVGADGANSLVRRSNAGVFEPTVASGRNKYIWLGTTKLFHGLTLTFVEHPPGVFAAHSYKFDRETSTFIVECSEETWTAAGLDRMTEVETCRFLEDVFARHLDGQPLLTKNFVRWLNFPLVRNERWHGERVVLLGDALHTAHFSIGSGTKLALEDAIVLAERSRTSRSRATRCRCSSGCGGRGSSSISRRRTRACAGSRRSATTCTSSRCRLPWRR